MHMVISRVLFQNMLLFQTNDLLAIDLVVFCAVLCHTFLVRHCLSRISKRLDKWTRYFKLPFLHWISGNCNNSLKFVIVLNIEADPCGNQDVLIFSNQTHALLHWSLQLSFQLDTFVWFGCYGNNLIKWKAKITKLSEQFQNLIVQSRKTETRSINILVTHIYMTAHLLGFEMKSKLSDTHNFLLMPLMNIYAWSW